MFRKLGESSLYIRPFDKLKIDARRVVAGGGLNFNIHVKL